MPKLNIMQIANAAPAQVNTPARVPTDDGSAMVGQALMNAGQQLGKIGAQVAQTQIASQLAEAETTAMMELHSLKTNLSRQGTAAVMGGFDPGSEEIRERLLDGMAPAVRNKFMPSFNKLYAQNRITAMSDGLKVDHQNAVAKATEQLDLLSKGVVPGSDSVDFAAAGVFGLKAINNLEAANAIDAAQAAKMRIKFQDGMAKNHVLSWINGNAVDIKTMKEARGQISSGKFNDPNLQNSWERLTEAEKNSMRSGWRRQMKDLLDINKAAEDELEGNVKREANRIKILHDRLLTEPPTAERSSFMMQNISKLEVLYQLNPDANLVTQAQLERMRDEARSGSSNTTFDSDAYDDLAERVRKLDITEDEILASTMIDAQAKERLVTRLSKRKSSAQSRAENFILNHPDFAKEGSPRQKDVLTKEQRQAQAELIEAAEDAEAAGLPFDFMKKAEELVKRIVENRTKNKTAQNEADANIVAKYKIQNKDSIDNAVRSIKDPQERNRVRQAAIRYFTR